MLPERERTALGLEQELPLELALQRETGEPVPERAHKQQELAREPVLGRKPQAPGQEPERSSSGSDHENLTAQVVAPVRKLSYRVDELLLELAER